MTVGFFWLVGWNRYLDEGWGVGSGNHGLLRAECWVLEEEEREDERRKKE